MPVFCYNAPNNTHKTNNNHKVSALITKQNKKKKISKNSTCYSKMKTTSKISIFSFSNLHQITDPTTCIS